MAEETLTDLGVAGRRGRSWVCRLLNDAATEILLAAQRDKSDLCARSPVQGGQVMLIQEMSREECFAHLGQRRLARLACAHEGQPYIVPIYCVHDRPTADEDYLYSFSTPGQKIEWMRANPLVCVEFDEVANSEQWVSIVIGGSYEELPPPPDEEPVLRGAIRSQPERAPERLHAWRLLQAHPMWWQPASAAHAPDPMLRTFAPIFYRIRIDRITGRRATGAESRPPEPPQGWLRRLMRRFFSGGKSVRRQKSRDGPGVR